VQHITTSPEPNSSFKHGDRHNKTTIMGNPTEAGIAPAGHPVDIPTTTTEASSTNEKQVASRTPSYVEAEASGWDAASTKRLIRKIDLKLIPFLAFLYLLSFLDRTNIGNARLDKLEEDLKMDKTGLQYNDALAVFFPFYVAAEIPSNMAMKRFRPSIWIPCIMVAWAVCTTLMGIVQNYTGLMVARSALGIAEGGLFPGVTY